MAWKTRTWQDYAEQVNKALPLSWSRIQSDGVCPLQAVSTWAKVSSMAFQSSPHSEWGIYGHKAFEDAILDGTFQFKDPQLAPWQSLLDAIKNLVGQGWLALPEYEMAYALDGSYTPSDYKDVDFRDIDMYRCNMDLILVSPCRTHLIILDWKTGKVSNPKFAPEYTINGNGQKFTLKLPASYQISLSLPAIVQHFPQCTSVVGIIPYVHYNEIYTCSHTIDEAPTMLNYVQQIHAQIKHNIVSGHILPMKRPNKICKQYCSNHICRNSFNANPNVMYKHITQMTLDDLTCTGPATYEG